MIPRLSAVMLVGLAGLAGLPGRAAAPSAPDTAAAEVSAPVKDKTLKERLSDKASDEQRVDNCGVPPDRRGPRPRPDCPPGTPPYGTR